MDTALETHFDCKNHVVTKGWKILRVKLQRKVWLHHEGKVFASQFSNLLRIVAPVQSWTAKWCCWLQIVRWLFRIYENGEERNKTVKLPKTVILMFLSSNCTQVNPFYSCRSFKSKYVEHRRRLHSYKILFSLGNFFKKNSKKRNCSSIKVLRN